MASQTKAARRLLWDRFAEARLLATSGTGHEKADMEVGLRKTNAVARKMNRPLHGLVTNNGKWRAA